MLIIDALGLQLDYKWCALKLCAEGTQGTMAESIMEESRHTCTHARTHARVCEHTQLQTAHDSCGYEKWLQTTLLNGWCSIAD
jgi:hypothetical protein